MVVLAVIWFFGWYIARFDHDDCLGALRQIGSIDPALFRSTQAECNAAGSVRQSIESHGLALLAFAELMLWQLARQKSPKG
jgi:hypothetical protein